MQSQVALGSACIPFVAVAAFSAFAQPLSLAEAMAEGASHAPELLTAQNKAATARAEVGAAAAAPPTTLSLQAGVDDPVYSIGLTQKLPSVAQGSRVAAASQDAESARLEASQAAAAVRASTRHAYFALWRDTQLVDLAAQTLRLTAAAESAARARYETGASPRLDLVQASVARATVQASQSAREAQRDSSSSELAVLLGRDPTVPIALANATRPGLPPLEKALVATAEGPLARARAADVNAAQSRLKAAYNERIPTMTLGALVEHNIGNAGYSLANHSIIASSLAPAGIPSSALGLRGAVDLDFPLFGFNHGEIAVASSRLEEAKLRRDLEARGRAAAVYSAHRRLSAALQTLQAYESEILPAAAEAEQMALDAYRSGRTTLAALLEAQRTAEDIRERSVEGAFEAQDAFAQLETAAGVPLDAP